MLGFGVEGLGFRDSAFVFVFGLRVLVDQNLYYRILTIKLVNQKRNYNRDSRYSVSMFRRLARGVQRLRDLLH